MNGSPRTSSIGDYALHPQRLNPPAGAIHLAYGEEEVARLERLLPRARFYAQAIELSVVPARAGDGGDVLVHRTSRWGYGQSGAQTL
jgi:hypothetical protein